MSNIELSTKLADEKKDLLIREISAGIDALNGDDLRDFAGYIRCLTLLESAKFEVVTN